MKNIFVVTQEQADVARKFEGTLLGLPKQSGITFVSAAVVEDVPKKDWALRLVVGCERRLEEGVVEALVWSTVNRDPGLELYRDRINLMVYRGVARNLEEHS